MSKHTLVFVELRRLTSNRKETNELAFLSTRYTALTAARFLPADTRADEYEDLRHLIVGGWVNALYAHLPDYDAVVKFITDDTQVDTLADTKELNPIFLMSIMTGNFLQARAVVSHIRREFPRAPILVGGVHPTLCPEETYELLQPDYLVAGEADEFIRDLIEASERRLPFHHDGVWNRSDGAPSVGRVVSGVAAIQWNWELHDRYSHSMNRTVANYVSTRSCPFQCHFCGIVKTEYREVDAKTSLRQMIDLTRYHDRVWIHWENPCCLRDIATTTEILNGIRGSGVSLAGQHRVEYPTKERRELYRLAADAGLNNMFLGIETVQDTTLKSLNKANHSRNVEPCLQALKDVGIAVNSGWIVGVPGQTGDDIKRDIEAAVDYIQRGLMAVALPQYLELYPGTWFWQNADRVGMEIYCDASTYDRITAGVTHRTAELSREEIWQYYCDFLEAVKGVVKTTNQQRSQLQLAAEDRAGS